MGTRLSQARHQTRAATVLTALVIVEDRACRSTLAGGLGVTELGVDVRVTSRRLGGLQCTLARTLASQDMLRTLRHLTSPPTVRLAHAHRAISRRTPSATVAASGVGAAAAVVSFTFHSGAPAACDDGGPEVPSSRSCVMATAATTMLGAVALAWGLQGGAPEGPSQGLG